MRRSWFVALIAAILASTLLSCSAADAEDMVTKEAALDIARNAFVASLGDQIREFEMSEFDSDDRYWRFSAEGTGEYARPGFHAFIEVDKKTGQATVIPGE
jgi:hypothetical protein